MHRAIMGRKRLAVILLAGAIAIVGTACLPDTGPPPGPENPYPAMMLGQVNADRANAGLPPLTYSPKLALLAGNHSCDMARAGSLFHTNLGALVGTGDYAAYWTMGENVLDAPAGTPISQMNAMWMNSGPHRANILSSQYNVIGIAFCNSGDGRIWATEEFGGL
jgi:uncharacterized protein YkwD